MRKRFSIALLIAVCACWVLAQANPSLQSAHNLLVLKIHPDDEEKALKLLSDSQTVQQACLMDMEEVIIQDGHGRRQEALTALILQGEGPMNLPGIRQPIHTKQHAVWLNRESAGRLLNNLNPRDEEVLLDGKPLLAAGSFKRLGFWPYLGFVDQQAFALVSGVKGANSSILIRMQPLYDSNMTVELIRNLMDQKDIGILSVENLGLKAGLVQRSIILLLAAAVLIILQGMWMRFLLPFLRGRLHKLRKDLDVMSLTASVSNNTGFLLVMFGGLLLCAAGLAALVHLIRTHWVVDVRLLPSAFSFSAMTNSLITAFRGALLPDSQPTLFMLQLRAAHVLVRAAGLVLLMAAGFIRRRVKNK